MRGLVEPKRGLRWADRLGGCALAVALGALAAALLLAAPARSALAATTQTRNYPGGSPCDTTLQACIDGANPGDTILIQPGTYYTSVTLNKAVSLTGVSSATVILHALPNQRVLTATGGTVDASVVISGLTFTGGSEMQPLGVGGGLLLTIGTNPRLHSIRVISNQASFVGGGVYAPSLQLANSVVQSNTAGALGGGIFTLLDANVTASRFEANACTLDECDGGGLYAETAALTATRFISNTARKRGGGLMATTAITLSGGLLEQNACTQADCTGGGLMTSGTLAAVGAVFTGNVAVDGGAGAWLEGAAALTGVQMHSNVSTGPTCWGGGLFSNLTVTVQGGQFVGNACRSGGGALYVGWLVLTDTLVMSNSAGTIAGGGAGGGAYVSFSAALSGGQFIGNFAAASGGGLVANSLSAAGTQFVNNRCGGAGGGAASGPAAVTSALFQGNACQGFYGSSGGGLYASSADIAQSAFISNAAEGTGGGLSSGGSLTLIETDFISNATQSQGGGAYSAGPANVSGGLFQQNQAALAGGGILSGGSAAITSAHFLSNTAGPGGGGIHAPDLSLSGVRLQGNDCVLAGCVGGGLQAASLHSDAETHFIQNTSLGGGGGAAVAGPAALSGTVLAGNACTEPGCQGAGLRAANGLALTATRFLGNWAAGMGGGLAHLSGGGSVVNALFARNSAGTAGAALYLASGGAVNVLHTTIATPSLGAGAAIDVVSGTVQIIDTLVATYSAGLRRLSAGSVFEDYNLFFGVSSPTVGVMTGGANDTSGDPRFINPAADDYHLRRGSAAIDAGADFAVTTDADGDPRPYGPGFDIGYDEAVERRIFVPVLLR